MCETWRQRLPDSASGLQPRLQVLTSSHCGTRAPGWAWHFVSQVADRPSLPLPPLACYLASLATWVFVTLSPIYSPTLDCRHLSFPLLKKKNYFPVPSHRSPPGTLWVTHLLPIILLLSCLRLGQSPLLRSSLRPSGCHPYRPIPTPHPRTPHFQYLVRICWWLLCLRPFSGWDNLSFVPFSLATKYHHPPFDFSLQHFC